MPRPKQRNADGIASQTVGNGSEEGVASAGVAADNKGIVLGNAEDIGIGTFHRHLFDKRESLLAIKQFYTVIVIPVAGNNHLSAVQFQSRNFGPLDVHAAKAFKSMGGGVVEFCCKGLSYTDILSHASCQKYLARLQHKSCAEVVIIDHLHQVPLAILVVFRRRGRYKAVGMTTDYCIFAIDNECLMARTGDVQVWQPLHLYLHHRAN